jgi:demethylmenaquinone methyltransferase/2-methoxy-6-polyprenyl-1,4-benzoquinol methylase
VKEEKKEISAGSFYDSIARLYNLTFRFNGYGRSIERYLYKKPLALPPGARVLDAGCGTGLLTLAMLKVFDTPIHITALDLSASSLEEAERAIRDHKPSQSRVSFVQANVLELPFPDHTFAMVATSGALEYVPLRDGLGELSRVLVPGGYLLHLPVHPSPFSKLLEVMFRFKAHPPREVAESTSYYFRILEHYRFPPLDPIGWSKTAMLAQKQ